jgi:hypothetical protein
MKTAILAAVAMVSASLLSAHQVRVQLLDENTTPIGGAETLISFTGVLIGGDDRHKGFSDKSGFFKASGSAPVSVFLTAEEKGYYSARLERLPRDRDLELKVVLPRIINPIALYALDSRVGRGGPPLRFPAQDEWLGYDFQAGDWIKPYGKGTTADIRFRFHQEFKGWDDNEQKLQELRKSPYNRDVSEQEFKLRMGKWAGELEISFPGEQEGLFEESRFLDYSELKMPHQAPIDGYQPTIRYTASTSSPPTARENVGFFLRTRVKLDQAGNIISANYAKVMGDFYLGATGVVLFAYYFNPTPNDRNLEFDPKQNLFPKDFPGAHARDP